MRRRTRAHHSWLRDGLINNSKRHEFRETMWRDSCSTHTHTHRTAVPSRAALVNIDFGLPWICGAGQPIFVWLDRSSYSSSSSFSSSSDVSAWFSQAARTDKFNLLLLGFNDAAGWFGLITLSLFRTNDVMEARRKWLLLVSAGLVAATLNDGYITR